jgi:predicted DNA-binding protein
MPKKTEVYAWRVSRATKGGLEEAARNSHRSVSELLEEIVTRHLETVERGGAAEQARQRQLHERAARCAGRIAGGNPRRSESVRELVRARLRRGRRAD